MKDQDMIADDDEEENIKRHSSEESDNEKIHVICDKQFSAALNDEYDSDDQL